MPQPPNASKAGSSLPGWTGPLYPLSLSSAAASGTLGVLSLFPEASSGFGKKACIPPVQPPSTSPHPGNSEQLPCCLMAALPRSVYRTHPPQHFLWVLLSSLWVASSSRITQTRISALQRVTGQPVQPGAQAPDSTALLSALWIAAPGVTRRELQWLLSNPCPCSAGSPYCRALVSSSLFFYCAKKCVTSNLPFCIVVKCT